MLAVLSFLAFAITFAGIKAFIVWGSRRRILDIPNERSLHTAPVPVGAGLVMSAVVMIGIVIASWPMIEIGKLSSFSIAVFVVSSIALVVVSWIDDVRSVSVALRFAVQGAAAAGLMLAFRGWTDVVGNDLLGGLAGFLWIVGLTNAYNFMDGIDGIAGMQAVTAGFGWLVIGAFVGSNIVAVFGGVLIASSIAFLVFNWQPAKVFMGDSGSAFIGFSLAAAPLMLAADSPVSLSFEFVLVSAALVWPFLFDSAITFLRRLAKGDKVWKPHRSHIYQRMVISGKSHQSVALIYGLLGIACAISAIAVVVIDLHWLTVVFALLLSGSVLFFLSPGRSEALDKV